MTNSLLKFFFPFCILLLLTNSNSAIAQNSGGFPLVISGVVDGPLPGGLPKAIELHVIEDIGNLSIFGVGSANNGQGTDGQEFTFPSDAATAGSCIYVASDSANFFAFFGFYPNYVDPAANINGDDAIELFVKGVVIDVFGDINVDGTGTPWEYLDGWAYRKNGTGPDGTTFVLGNWNYSGINALDNQTTNSSAPVPFPICTYSPVASGDPEFTFSAPSIMVNEDVGTVDVTVSLSETSNCTVQVALGIFTTATAGSDFTFTSPTTLTFTAGGDTAMVISIPISDDMEVENTEDIILLLQNPGGADGCVIGTPNQVLISISDNDFLVSSIADIHGEDEMGVALSDNDQVEITGIVHCIDFRENSGYDFYLVDSTGGVNVFEFDDVDAYQAIAGDEITIQGSVDQFRGLTEIRPATITLNSAGNPTYPYNVVTALGESTEGIPVSLESVTLVNPASWTTGTGSFGFIVDFSNGVDTFEVLVDNDTPMYNQAAPSGPHTVSGMGSQRSSSSSAPFLDGYRIIACSVEMSTGIEVPEWSAEISLKPNPFSNSLEIELGNAEIDHIQVHNVLGMLVNEISNPSQSVRIDLPNLSPGMYIVSFSNTDGIYSKKVIKQ